MIVNSASFMQWRISFLVVVSSVVLFFLATTLLAAKDDKPLWDLRQLGTAPSTEPADDFGVKTLHAIFFPGEPWQGKPTKVYAYYGFPVGASRSAPVPGIVCVHGGGGTAFAEWVQIWNKHGFAAIALDTNGSVPQSFNESPDKSRHQWPGPAPYGFNQSGDAPRDQWPYHAVAGVIRAHSLLRSFPEVDSANVGITGISWGGYLTCLAAGVDPRFKFAIPVYGCGFLDDGSTWAQMIDDYGHDRWMSLWDPSSYLGEGKMATLWISGTNDAFYHLGPFQKTYRLSKGPCNLSIRVRMDHSHGAGWSPPEIYAFANAMVGKGSPLVSITNQGRDANKAWIEFQTPRDIRVEAVELIYTKDRGDWVKRDWKSTAAQLKPQSHRAVVKLPADTAVYYFNVHDSRGLLTSSEHVEVREK